MLLRNTLAAGAASPSPQYEGERTLRADEGEWIAG